MGIPFRNLPTVLSSEVQSGDSISLNRANQGWVGKLSLSGLIDYLKNNFTDTTFTAEPYVPVTGQSITVTQDTKNRWMLFQPAGTLATLTLVLPSPTASTDGQEILVTSTEALTALTVNGNGATAVNGAPTSLAADGFFKLKYNKENLSWFRVG